MASSITIFSSLVSVFYSTFTSNSAPCRRLLHRKRTDGLKVVKSNENITFQLRPRPAGGKFIYALAAPRYLHLTPTFVQFSTQGQQVKLPMYLRKRKSKRREIVVVDVPPPYFFYLLSGNYFRVKNDSCFGTNWIYLPFAPCAHDDTMNNKKKKDLYRTVKDRRWSQVKRHSSSGTDFGDSNCSFPYKTKSNRPKDTEDVEKDEDEMIISLAVVW